MADFVPFVFITRPRWPNFWLFFFVRCKYERKNELNPDNHPLIICEIATEIKILYANIRNKKSIKSISFLRQCRLLTLRHTHTHTSLRTEHRIEWMRMHKIQWSNKDFQYVSMSNEDNLVWRYDCQIGYGLTLWRVVTNRNL